ncbi:MAG: aminotransferase class I/II-fold pyridoxal phosphate-dependent enzyme [Microbacterium gubbeenense]
MPDFPLEARVLVARAHDTTPDRVALASSVTVLVRALAGSAVDEEHPAGLDTALDPQAARERILFVASPSVPEGRALTRDELGRLIEATPEGGLVIIDESLSAFATSPRAAFAAPLLAPATTDPRVAIVRTAPTGAAYAIAAPGVIAGLATEAPTAEQLAAIARSFSPDGLDEVLDRAEWVAAERQRLERTLRDRMERAELDDKPFIDIVHSDGDAVWIPVGDRSAALAARAGGSEFPGAGVRYEIGSDNDAFVDAVSEWATS